MVEIKTELTPFKLTLMSRAPVELMVEIENNSNKEQMISYDIILSNQLAFDKAGRSNAQTKRFDALQPGERIRDYFEVFPKITIQKGAQPIYISIMEHFNKDYKYILSKKTKELTLRVD